MARPRVNLTSHDLLYAASRGEIPVARVARLEGVSVSAVRRIARDLGITFPRRFRDTSRMGRPPGPSKSQWLDDDTPIIEEPVLTVSALSTEGEDLYLARLQSVHVFPRSEVYPGSRQGRPKPRLLVVA